MAFQPAHRNVLPHYHELDRNLRKDKNNGDVVHRDDREIEKLRKTKGKEIVALDDDETPKDDAREVSPLPYFGTRRFSPVDLSLFRGVAPGTSTNPTPETVSIITKHTEEFASTPTFDQVQLVKGNGNEHEEARKRRKLTPIEVVKGLTQNPPSQNPNFSFSFKEHPDTTLTLSIGQNVTINDHPSNPNAQMKVAEFDGFIKSLNKVIPQPAKLDSGFMFNESNGPSPEILDLRNRLSSLLPIDFRILVDPPRLAEVVDISAKLLQNDPGLSSYQISMLKLIQELPSISKDMDEIKELAEHMELFLCTMESNLAKVSYWRKEYQNSQKTEQNLQAQVEENEAAIKEIDEQIAKLQVRRFELANKGDIKKKIIMEFGTWRKTICDNLLKVATKVQSSDLTKEELLAKRQYLHNRCGEIKAKFLALYGFRI